MTTLTQAPNYYTRIINRAALQPTTKHQYAREMDKLTAAGIDPRNRAALLDYAEGLKPSSRAFLKAALALVLSEFIETLKGRATPENLNEVQAALLNIESITSAITTTTPKGEKIHIWLTPEQVRKLSSLPDTSTRQGKRDLLALSFLLHGLRRSELTGLKFNDIFTIPGIDGDGVPIIRVKGKGAKYRTVPLKFETYDLTEEWRQEIQAENGELIFRGLTRGQLSERMSDKAVYLIVQKYGALIGLPDLQPHDLRRTFGQMVYQGTQDIMQTMTLLGHESPTVTKRYLNLSLNLTSDITQYIPIGGHNA